MLMKNALLCRNQILIASINYQTSYRKTYQVS